MSTEAIVMVAISVLTSIYLGGCAAAPEKF